MNNTLKYFILLFSVAMFSCKDQIEEVYTVNEPVYMSYEALRTSFKVTSAQEIIQPGKIYFKDDLIFVNEYQKGIHIIDNHNPASPEIISFIEIPGNVDLAVKDSILYADSYIDLVAIDISDLNHIKEVNRIENAFPYFVPGCEDGVVEEIDQNKGVVIRWNRTERKVSIEDANEAYHQYPIYNREFFMADASSVKGGNTATSGTGGSMARFTIYDKYLYAVDNYMLRLFDISDPRIPVFTKQQYVGWNIETMFPYEQKLFLGSTTGMYIFSLTDPSNPTYISAFWHASSCDPVVVEGNLAYVTLRAGNLCGDNQSLLNVIDISDIANPVLLKEYPLEEPYGLGIDNKILFVCDGDAGLKIYDATDPLLISDNKLAQYGDINAWDVIPLGHVLVMIGTDGLYQYDYSDPENIALLSTIPIEHLTHQQE